MHSILQAETNFASITQMWFTTHLVDENEHKTNGLMDENEHKTNGERKLHYMMDQVDGHWINSCN
jgi:hypothetical protein